MENRYSENEISKIVYELGYSVHRTLGAGLLEKVYEECLFYELSNAGLFVEKQKPIPINYKHLKFDSAFKLDLLVEKKFIIEVKATDLIYDIYMAQILTYLRMTNIKLGYLMNFNVVHFKDGVKRVINGQL